MIKAKAKASTKKNKCGQPTKYREAYCEVAIELMKLGYAKVEVAYELDICEDTLYEWAKVHKKFSEALKIGESYSRGFWYKEGRENLKNKEFNSGLWLMNMKNRHGWSDKRESTSTITVKHEDAIKELE